jgi:hypothetical protein
LTDYQGNGDLLARTLNLDLDRVWLVLQEIFNGGKGPPNSLRVPNGETVSALPAAASRASQLLGFDGNGQPILVSPANGSSADLALRLADGSLVVNGDAMIGVKRTATGAVATTQHAVNEARVLNAMLDFGAVGNGIVDDSLALNIATAAAIASGLELYIPQPPVAYLLVAYPVQLCSQTDTAILRPAIRFRGAGIAKTKFLNRTGDYALKHTVTFAQSAAQSKAYSGFIGGFTITHDGSSPAGSAGIALESFWMGRLEDAQIESPKGHGVAVLVNGALSANSDHYSCGNLRLKRVGVSSATGIGIYHNSPGTTLFSDEHYVTGCALGGMYTCGANGAINNGALAGNSTFGLKIAYTTTTPHNIEVRGNEIDNNAGRQVIVEGYHNFIEQNRFIQTEVAGAFPATDSVYIDSATSGGASENVIGHNLMDVRSRVSGTHNFVTTTDSAGTTGNKVRETVFSATAGLTKYNFLGTTRVRNIATENGLVVANSAQTPVGERAIAVVALGGSQTLTTTAVQKIQFVTERSDESGAWDITNHRFTVPHRGLMRISGGILGFALTTPGTAFQLHVYKHGALEHTIDFPRGLFATGTSETVPINLVLRAAAGDYFELFGQCGTASRINFGSSNFQTITFEML